MAMVLEALSQRRARRAFAPTPVPQDVRDVLWQAVQVAPSHGNAQPTRILVADSEAARSRLIAALSEGNRNWAPAAPLLFALIANPSHDNVMQGEDGVVRELWPFHAGIAAGNLMAQATALGLTAHPMASFDEQRAREAFGAPAEVRVLAIFAIGYPGEAEMLPDDLQERESSPQERIGIRNLVGIDAWNDEMGVSARELRKRARA